MEKRRREVWWLLALEATLFLSLPFWESTAPWAEPIGKPYRFSISLIFAATAAMFACHLGPASLATKFGDRPSRHRFSQVLLVWLGFGYIAWTLSMAQSVAVLTAPVRIAGEDQIGIGWFYPGVMAALVAVVMIVAWVRSWWKPFAVSGLLLGSGILVWALATTWRGLWTRNPFYSETPAQFDWLIIRGLLLCAAPAVAIAWRIGCIESEPRRIWFSGFFGVWLPLVLSLTAASLADQAGANLYWAPSLPRGFTWALLGSHGRLTPTVTALTTCTLIFPALLSIVSLRLLLPLWARSPKRWLILTVVCLFVCAVISQTWHYEGLYSLVATPTHQFWAGSLVVLGAAAGLVGIVYPVQPGKRA